MFDNFINLFSIPGSSWAFYKKSYYLIARCLPNPLFSIHEHSAHIIATQVKTAVPGMQFLPMTTSTKIR